jgi:hypothetical protein
MIATFLISMIVLIENDAAVRIAPKCRNSTSPRLCLTQLCILLD